MSETNTLEMTAREADRAMLAAGLRQVIQVVEGGPWDGRRVIAVEDAQAVLDTPLAPYNGYATEVRADNDGDGRILEWLGCPRCGQVQPTTTVVRARLQSERDGNVIEAVHVSKKRTHECGQAPLPLPGTPGSENQTTAWDISDITRGDRSDPDNEP